MVRCVRSKSGNERRLGNYGGVNNDELAFIQLIELLGLA